MFQASLKNVSQRSGGVTGRRCHVRAPADGVAPGAAMCSHATWRYGTSRRALTPRGSVFIAGMSKKKKKKKLLKKTFSCTLKFWNKVKNSDWNFVTKIYFGIVKSIVPTLSPWLLEVAGRHSLKMFTSGMVRNET